MPYIDVKVTTSLTHENKENIKRALGKHIEIIPGKHENSLMIGLLGDYTLYLSGDRMNHAAYVEVKMFKMSSTDDKAALYDAICQLLQTELDISPEHVYVTFHDHHEWGYRGNLIRDL